MKKSWKRILALALAVVLVLGTTVYMSDYTLKATDGDGQQVTQQELDNQTDTIDLSADNNEEGGSEDPIDLGEESPSDDEGEGTADDGNSEQQSDEETTPDITDDQNTDGSSDIEMTGDDQNDDQQVDEEVTEEEPGEVEEEPAEEIEEIRMPEQTISTSANDGAMVVVSAPEGAFPEGVYVTATLVKTGFFSFAGKQIEAAVENAVENMGLQLVEAKTYDITIYDTDGNEIQPEVPVSVNIVNSGLDDGDTVVFHYNEAEQVAEPVAYSDSANDVEFNADGFSNYIIAVVGPTENGSIESVTIGETIQLDGTDNAYGLCGYGSWTSDNAAVATVDSKGKVTAKSAGTATIVHTYCANKNVHINGHTTREEVFTVAVSNPELKAGDTISIKGTGNAHSNCKYIGSWTSSDTSIATVDNNGAVTGVSAGTVKITHKYCSQTSNHTTKNHKEKEESFTLTIVATDPSIKISPESAEITTLGGTAAFTAKLENMQLDSTVVWTSSDEDVATVHNGVVTAVGGGTATITATAYPEDDDLQGETYTDTVEVTVNVPTYTCYHYALIPGESADGSTSANSRWYGLGETVIEAPNPASLNTGVQEDLTYRTVSVKKTLYPDLTYNGKVYKYAETGSEESFEEGYYTAVPYRLVVSNQGANSGNNGYNTTVGSGYTYHLDYVITMNENDYRTVSFNVMYPGASEYSALTDYAKRVKDGTLESSFAKPSGSVVEATKTYDGLTYRFDGWYKDSDCTQPAAFDGSITGNTAYYAHYVPTEQYYTVNYYYDGNLDSSKTVKAKAAIGTEISTYEEKLKEGYKFQSATVSADAPLVVGANASQNVINVYYSKRTVVYNINYYLNGTTIPVRSSDSKSGKYGDEVSGTLKTISGYTAVPGQEETQTITLAEGTTAINFYYYQNVTLTANSGEETYDGSEKSVAGFTGAPEGSDFSSITAGVSATTAGSYDVVFSDGAAGTVDATSKYVVTEVNNGTLKINKADASLLGLSASDYTGTYNATAQGTIATAAVSEGTTISYSIDGENWTTTPPSRTDAGTTTVKVKAENPNYNTATGSYNIKINPAAVTVKAANSGKTYGETDPALTAIVSGTYGGDTVSYEVTRESGENVGPYAITAAGEKEQGNYTVSYVPATFTITKAGTLTVTGTSYSGTYDGSTHGAAAVPSVTSGTTVSYRYKVEGSENWSDWSETVPTKTNAGKATVEVKAENPNYNDATCTYTLEVTPKTVTVAAADKTKTYGTSDPEFTASVSGTLGDDTVAYTFEREKGEAVNTSGYVITVTGDEVQGNYAVSYVPAKLYITKSSAGFTVTGPNYSGEYDGNAHGDAATADVTEGTTYKYSINGGATWSETAPTITNVGSINVIVKAENPNYEDATDTYTLEVTPKPVTVTANNATKVFGESDPAFTAAVEGTLGEDTVEYTFTREIGEDVNETGYAVTPSGAEVQGNYSVAYAPGTLTITKADNLGVEGTDIEVIYDAAEHGVAAVPSDARGTVIKYSVNGGEYTTSVPKVTNVGEYKVDVLALNSNYESATCEYTIKITPKAVTVTAANSTKEFGAEDPEFTADVSGVIDGYSIGYTVARTSGEDAGSYTITPSGDAQQGNYSVTYVTGTFIISKAKTLTVTGTTYNAPYDGNAHGEAASVSVTDGTTVKYSKDGGETWSEKVPQRTNVGTTNVIVKAENKNYDDATATYSITVTKAAVTVTAKDASKTYGESDPELEADVTGLIGEDTVSYNVERAEGEAAGTYVITASGNASQNNYAVTYKAGTFTINGKNIDSLVGTPADTTYDGESHQWIPSIVYGDETLVNNVDYTVAYKRSETATGDFVNVGTITVVITGTGNYTGSVEKTYRILPKKVTVKAEDNSKIYGENDPQLIAIPEGLVGNDTLAYSIARETGEEAGAYAIAATGEPLQGNYEVEYLTGTFTINAKSMKNVTIDTPSDSVYDAQAHKWVPAVTDGNKTLVEGTDYTVSYGTTDFINTGEITVTITGIGNYDGSVKKTYRITQKPVTVTAINKSKAYGDADPELTAEVNGNLNGDEIIYSISRAEGESVNGSPYVITVTGEQSQGNYSVSYVNAGLTITKSNKLSVSVTGYDGTYNAGAHFGTVSPSVTAGTAVSYSTDNGENWTETAPSITDVGSVTVKVKAENADYDTAYGEYTLKVAPKAVTVTADNKSKTYNEQDPELTAKTEGTLGTDTVTYELSREAGEDVKDGGYVITAAGDKNQGNYVVTYKTGILTITKADGLTVSGESYDKVYDAKSHGSAAAVNIIEGTALSYSTDNGATWTSEAPSITDVGTVNVLVKAENNNYNTATGSYSLKVTPAEVTVTAVDKTKVYGEDDPEFTANVNGTLGSDTVAYTLSRVSGTSAGEYAITPAGDKIQGNYEVTYNTGKLTITAKGLDSADISATIPDNATFDGKEHKWLPVVTDGTSVLTAGIDYDVTYSVNNFINSGTISVTITGKGNYEGTITREYAITPAAVKVTADNKSKTYGETDPSLTVSTTGLIGADTVDYSISRADGEDAGEYTITPSGNADQGNYTVTFETGIFTISKNGSLTVSGTDYEGTYDGNVHGAAASPSVTSGTTVSYSVDGGKTWSGNVPTIKNQGTINVQVKAENKNYNEASATYTLQVNRKAVTVTADNKTKTYGAADSEFTASVDGTIGSDKVKYSLSRTEGESAGEYTITPAGDKNQGNYSVEYVPGTLSIEAKNVNAISVSEKEDYTYDGTNHKWLPVVTDGEKSLAEGIDYTVNYVHDGADAADLKNAGEITVTITGTGNYTGTVIKTYRINRRAVTVTAEDKEKTFGETDPALTAGVANLVEGESVDYSLSRSEGEAEGTYTIAAAGNAEQGNYSVTFVNGTFKIKKKSLENADITISTLTDEEYSASEIKKAPVVKDNGKVLVENKDYELSYSTSDFTNVGTITVTVKGKGNYSGSINTSYKITHATATVTAENKEKTYGDADPQLTATVSGMKGSDSTSLINYSLTRKPGNSVTGSPYVITPSGDEVQGNYNVVYVTANLTITKSGELSVSGTDYEGTYDGAAHGSAASASVINGTTVSYSVNGGEWTTAVPQITDAGIMTVTVKAENPDYNTAEATYTLKVNRKAVTVTAKDNTKVYGSDDPALTADVTGTVGDDIVAYEVSRAEGEDTGTYKITASGDEVQGNYSVAYGDAEFVITKKPNDLVVSGKGYEGIYDGKAHSGIPGESNHADSTITFSTDGGETWTSEAPSITDVGSKTVIIRAEHRNYVTATGTYTLTVTPKAVTVTAQDKAKTYGEADPDNTATVESRVSESDAIAFGYSREPGENAGTYKITPTGAVIQGNYTVTYAAANLVINPKVITEELVADNPGDYTYNANEQKWSPSVTDNETVLSVGKDYTVTYKRGDEITADLTNAGTITVIVGGTGNYTGSITREYVIKPKVVTVKANNASKVYKAADPEFTAETSGTLNGDEIEYTLSRAEGEKVTSAGYVITPAGDEIQGNYKVTYETGTFTITKSGELTVGGTEYKGAYDGQAHGAAASVNVTVETTVSYSIDGGNTWTSEVPTITNAGKTTVNVKAENSDYETATASYTLEVTHAPVTVTADDTSKVYGTEDPEKLTATVDGTIGTDKVSYEVTRKSGEDAGTYKITASGDEIQGNYKVTYKTGTFTINKAPAVQLGLKADGYTGTYDAKSHKGTVTADVTKGTTFTYRYKADGAADFTAWSETEPARKNAGTAVVEVKAENPNYNTATATYELTVNRKLVTVTPDSTYKIYGQADPEKFTATVAGLEDDAVIEYTVNREAGTDAGTYALTAAGAETQGNYTVEYKTGTFEIRKAEMSLTAPESTVVTYNADAHSVTAVPGVEAGTTVSYSTDGGTTWTTEVPSITNVGTLNVKVKAENKNYETAETEYSIVVEPKPVTVIADPKTKEFDTEDPELTATVTGLIGEDTITYSISREPGEEIGQQKISVTGEQYQGNYVITYTDAVLEITANSTNAVSLPEDVVKTYDGETVTIEAGALEGSTIYYCTDYDSETKTGTWTTEPPQFTDAGNYTVYGYASKDGYKDTEVKSMTVSIGKKDIKVVTGSDSKIATEAFNEEAAVEGIVSDETYDITATGKQSEPGESDNTYELTTAGEGNEYIVKASNYSITEDLGLLKVRKAKFTVNYEYSDGTQAAEPYVAEYMVGDEVEKVVSPSIAGYYPDKASITIENKDGENKWYLTEDLEITVKYYVPYVPGEDDPENGEGEDIGDPEPPVDPPLPVIDDDNDVDVDEDNGSKPDGNGDGINHSANGTGDRIPAGSYVPVGDKSRATSDEDGNYKIVEIEDEDTPLADLDLDRICILHWIILLIALICGIIYFITNNKLRRRLDELEKGNR